MRNQAYLQKLNTLLLKPRINLLLNSYLQVKQQNKPVDIIID